jgi:hypothetical protein
MRVRIVVAVGAFGALVGLGSASGQSVQVSPANSTTADSVRVTAYSGFPQTGCWQIGGPVCGFVQPDTLRIIVAIGYCNGLPSCLCTAFPMSYQRTCTFGPLPAGTYVAKFVELHTSSYDRLRSFTRTAQFEVTGTTPARGRTWGALKSIYR